MKPADLRRPHRLATRQGLEIEVTEGGGHTKVRFNGRRSTVPRHATDLKSVTFRAIPKQLGLAEGDPEV